MNAAQKSVESLELSEAFNVVFAELVKHKESQIEIEEELAAHDIPRGTFTEILYNPERSDLLNQVELCLLSIVLHKVTNDDRIKPSLFYSKTEISKAMKYKRPSEDELTLPHTFESVLKAGGDDYITVLSYQEIAKLWNSKILTYNFQTQRLSKKKVNAKGSVIEKPDVNLKSVKNIVRLMKEGKYRPSTLLFNILVDGNDNIEYNNGDLTINEGTTLNVIDGYHRLQAIVTVIEENPNFEAYMNVDIKHYPLEIAQQLLAITNTVNRFDKTLVKTYMAESQGAQIAKDLMNIPELKNRVSIKTTLDKKMNYITNFAVLSESVESIFAPESTKERYDDTEVLKKFFGYLIASYSEAFGSKTMKEFAKTSWLNHHNTVVGMVVIAKKLYDKYGKDFPVDEIVRVIDSINLSREDSEFNTLMTSQGKVNSNQVKRQIRKFFEEKADQLLA